MSRKPLTHISVSSILDYQRCPLRWCFKWIDNRVPRYEPQALAVGKAIHLAFERHFTDGTPVGQALRDHLSSFSDALLTERERKAHKELLGLCEPLDFWKDAYPVTETLEVEQPFEYVLPNGFIFQGRPDRVVLLHGAVHHMQHKTIAAQRDLSTYVNIARRSMHELLYGDFLARKYPDKPYGGTIYNVVRKLKYRSEAKGKEDKILHPPEEFFLQTPIAIDPFLQDQALKDLYIWSGKMQDTAHKYAIKFPIPSSRVLDEDMFSRRPDPYFEVLTGEASLDDETKFMDRRDQYNKEEEEDA